MKTIVSVSELQNILEAAKCGGQFVTITYQTKVDLRVNPTDGSAVGKRDKSFIPFKRTKAQYHFAEDYDKKMSKILGEEYKASDENREHLVHNVLMKYKSTNNVCFIVMPTASNRLGYFHSNGTELNSFELETMKHYIPKPKDKPLVNYRTIGVLNVIELCINHEVYQVKISSLE